MLQEDLIWLSGLFEGEASFTVQNEKHPTGITIEMTDEDVIQKVCRLIGSKYFLPKRRKSHHKQSYKTAIRGYTAINLMKQLLPYMGVRRSNKIKECIDSYYKKPKGLISKDQVKEVRDRFLKGEKPKEIAKDYQVSYWRIYQLVRDLRTFSSGG